MNPLYLIAAALLLLAVVVLFAHLDMRQHNSRSVYALEQLAEAAGRASYAHVRMAQHHGTLAKATAEWQQRASQIIDGLAAGMALGLVSDGMPDLSALFPVGDDLPRTNESPLKPPAAPVNVIRFPQA